MSNARAEMLRDAPLLAPASAAAPVPANSPITLTPVEAAYVAMVEGEYQGAIAMAKQLRTTRFAVVWTAHGIADGSTVSIAPSEPGGPMQLVVAPPSGRNGNGASA